MDKYQKMTVFSLLALSTYGSAFASEYTTYDMSGSHAVKQEEVGVVEEYPTFPGGMDSVLFQQMQPEDIDAQEFKLKIREIASQLLDVYEGTGLQGRIAVPTSFVNLDNFNQTTSFGRYLSEALFYEFNVRGFPVLEYRLDGDIDITKDGEFALTRAIPKLVYKNSKMNDILLVGTYYRDVHSLFVNARLVQPDGLVLRTAQLVIPVTGVLERMTVVPKLPPLSTGALPIRRK